MTREQKQEVIEVLKDKFSQYSNFYITNTESLTVSQITTLRRTCYDKNVEMKVAKNTLIKKALESLDSERYSGVYDALHQVTALMFSENPKDPAVIISSFRKEGGNKEKPELKAAFLNGEVYLGDDQLTALTKIKTKDELIGDVIGLLLSPIQRVVGALQNKPEEVEVKAEATEATEEAAPAPADTPAADAKAEEAPAAEAKTEEASEAETPADEQTPKAEGSDEAAKAEGE